MIKANSSQGGDAKFRGFHRADREGEKSEGAGRTTTGDSQTSDGIAEAEVAHTFGASTRGI